MRDARRMPVLLAAMAAGVALAAFAAGGIIAHADHEYAYKGEFDLWHGSYYNDTLWPPETYPPWSDFPHGRHNAPNIHVYVADWVHDPDFDASPNSTDPIRAILGFSGWSAEGGYTLVQQSHIKYTPSIRTQYNGTLSELPVEYVLRGTGEYDPPGAGDHGKYAVQVLMQHTGNGSTYVEWGKFRDHITREEYRLQALPYDHWELPTDVMANYTGPQNKTHVWINDLYTRWQYALVSYDDQIAAYEDLRRQAAEAHAGIMLAHAGLSEAERLIGVYMGDMDRQLGGTTYTDGMAPHMNLTRAVPPTHP